MLSKTQIFPILCLIFCFVCLYSREILMCRSTWGRMRCPRDYQQHPVSFGAILTILTILGRSGIMAAENIILVPGAYYKKNKTTRLSYRRNSPRAVTAGRRCFKLLLCILYLFEISDTKCFVRSTAVFLKTSTDKLSFTYLYCCCTGTM